MAACSSTIRRGNHLVKHGEWGRSLRLSRILAVSRQGGFYLNVAQTLNQRFDAARADWSEDTLPKEVTHDDAGHRSLCFEYRNPEGCCIILHRERGEDSSDPALRIDRGRFGRPSAGVKQLD